MLRLLAPHAGKLLQLISKLRYSGLSYMTFMGQAYPLTDKDLQALPDRMVQQLTMMETHAQTIKNFPTINYLSYFDFIDTLLNLGNNEQTNQANLHTKSSLSYRRGDTTKTYPIFKPIDTTDIDYNSEVPLPVETERLDVLPNSKLKQVKRPSLLTEIVGIAQSKTNSGSLHKHVEIYTDDYTLPFAPAYNSFNKTRNFYRLLADTVDTGNEDKQQSNDLLKSNAVITYHNNIQYLHTMSDTINSLDDKTIKNYFYQVPHVMKFMDTGECAQKTIHKKTRRLDFKNVKPDDFDVHKSNRMLIVFLDSDENHEITLESSEMLVKCMTLSNDHTVLFVVPTASLYQFKHITTIKRFDWSYVSKSHDFTLITRNDQKFMPHLRQKLIADSTANCLSAPMLSTTVTNETFNELKKTIEELSQARQL